MKPHDDYRNGDDESGSDEGSEGEEGAEVVVEDATAPARALRALNALRKSRQHYDVLLRAAPAPGAAGAPVPAGADVAAHRAVLAAHAPYLLAALATPDSPPGGGGGGPPVYRVEGVEAEALRALVEYMYTGRLAARAGPPARALYRAAWRLRLEAAAAALAERLARRPQPHDALELRALPDLPPHTVHALDAYIAHNFDAICESGALAALPLVRIELLAGAGGTAGADAAEAPLAVAEAALAFLRDHHADTAVEEVCARAHLVYVDEAGALRDCGELPAARGDAPELREYRRAAQERRAPPPPPPPAQPPRALPALELGARRPRPDTAVLAARGADANGGGRRVTRALVSLRGRLAAARISCSAAPAPGAAGEARGGAGAGDTRARLATGRCAAGAAALGARLLVCGGYDRARALRSAEAYEPAANEWAPLPDMRSARARFPAVCVGGAVYALGGSDGQNELDSVDVYEEKVAAGGGVAVGVWAARARMPVARSHAAAAAAGGALFVLGGWAGGRSLAHVARYEPARDAWQPAPALAAPRSQCAAALWRGALWALGGCDAWHCLASTERLPLPLEGDGAAWQPGPALPAARRSAGAAEWRGRLVLAGGSDGAASLRRTDWLLPAAAQEPAWRAGPALRRARAALGLAVVEDVLYAVGGFDGKEFLSCVECLYAPDGEWTTLCAPPAPRAPPASQPTENKLAANGDQHEEAGGAESGAAAAGGGEPAPACADTAPAAAAV